MRSRARSIVVALDQPVAQPQGERFFASYPATRVKHVQRVLLAHDARQARGDPEAWVETQACERRPETRLGRGNSEVGNEGKAKTGADRSPLHCGDDGNRPTEHPLYLCVKWIDVTSV